MARQTSHMGLMPRYRGEYTSDNRFVRSPWIMLTTRTGLIDPERALGACVPRIGYINPLIGYITIRPTCLDRTAVPMHSTKSDVWVCEFKRTHLFV